MFVLKLWPSEVNCQACQKSRDQRYDMEILVSISVRTSWGLYPYIPPHCCQPLLWAGEVSGYLSHGSWLLAIHVAVEGLWICWRLLFLFKPIGNSVSFGVSTFSFSLCYCWIWDLHNPMMKRLLNSALVDLGVSMETSQYRTNKLKAFKTFLKII